MKVKITKAERPTFWYANKIGQIFEVEGVEYNEDQLKCVDNNNDWIKKCDCEVIEEMQIGDKVRVINNGDNYSTYPKWFDKYAPQYKYLYKQEYWTGNYFEDSGEENEVYTIVAKGKHLVRDEDMVLIKNGERVFLLKEKGVEKVKFSKTDLKTGHLVLWRGSSLEDKWFLVLKDTVNKRDIAISNDGEWIDFDGYDDDLRYGKSNSKIVKVATIRHINDFMGYSNVEDIPGFSIVWQRETEEQIKLKQEIEELKRQLAEKEELLNA